MAFCARRKTLLKIARRATCRKCVDVRVSLKLNGQLSLDAIIRTASWKNTYFENGISLRGMGGQTSFLLIHLRGVCTEKRIDSVVRVIERRLECKRDNRYLRWPASKPMNDYVQTVQSRSWISETPSQTMASDQHVISCQKSCFLITV